jgi:hypothetical protein
MGRYRLDDVAVLFDDDKDLPYVVDNGKRLYFMRGQRARDIAKYYLGLRIEQDRLSPHLYLEDLASLKGRACALDIGAAEGLIALRMIDYVDRVFLFEYTEGWIEALRATFEPYAGKVEIVRKFVSDTDGEGRIRLDTFFAGRSERVDFIKMDIEGAEAEALRGAERILREGAGIQLAVCAYHSDGAYDEIAGLLGDFDLSTSRGYMLMKGTSPYFRRGMIRAAKKTGHAGAVNPSA